MKLCSRKTHLLALALFACTSSTSNNKPTKPVDETRGWFPQAPQLKTEAPCSDPVIYWFDPAKTNNVYENRSDPPRGTSPFGSCRASRWVVLANLPIDRRRNSLQQGIPQFRGTTFFERSIQLSNYLETIQVGNGPNTKEGRQLFVWRRRNGKTQKGGKQKEQMTDRNVPRWALS